MAVNVRAGSLRQLIIIQQQVTTRNNFGEKDNTWVDLASVYASVNPLHGREFVENRIAQSEVTHRIHIRHYPNLTTKQHRIILGTRVLEIETLLNIDERNVMLELLCIENDIES